ncbi:MAG: NADPH-dependent glutamate synthase [Chitinispirillales bacterium]|nr:NADPH-dependent glutamate synthase [Chitinispirillales bacterium]
MLVTARIAMKEQDPIARGRNFNEVPYGYTGDEAKAEAARCLQCKKPLCVEGCPVNVKIPEFIGLIAAGDFIAAAKKIKETNALPAICGRVCPQETQCEARCILGKKGESVAIGNLERFAADTERESGNVELPPKSPSNGKSVAVVGSGPAGLTCAGELVKTGFDVTVFEALHEAGGVLVYGIPEFRLPKAIVKKEIEYLEALGVKIVKNFVVGRTATVDELFEDEKFDAVFVGSGAGLPSFMGIKGENGIGVYSANEYLTRSNLMKAYIDDPSTPIIKGKRVITVGGGNVAMDSARTALRLGAEKSMIVYRRSEAEMPARAAEIHHAKEEGIEFNLLCNPVEIIAGENGAVTGVKCVRMELGEPDASGRRRPVEVKGSEFVIDCDVAVIAIGNSPNPLIPNTTPGLKVNEKRGTISANEADGRTSKRGVYAGGDIVTGAATVILAMGAGKTAAESIALDLTPDPGLEDLPPYLRRVNYSGPSFDGNVGGSTRF